MTEVLITKIVVGTLCGIWPLLVGFKSKQLLLGVVGFFLALGGGLITGFLLAAPVAYGCGWYMERRASAAGKAAPARLDSAADSASTTD